MDTLNFGEELVDAANAWPAGYNLRIWLSILVGTITGSVVFATGAVTGPVLWVLCTGAPILAWNLLGKISRNHPLARPGAIGITNRRFVAFRGSSRDVISEHSLAEYESHTYRRGFDSHGLFVSPKLVVRFQDGDEWRVSGPLGSSGPAEFVYTLEQLTADD